MSNDAFIHQLEVGIAACPRQVSRVVDFIARLEQRHICTDRLDYTTGVPADDARGCSIAGSWPLPRLTFTSTG